MNTSSSKPLLVVGAGIAGVTAALEAAETGGEVILVECEPAIGGRVLKNFNYFPKLCPPSCGMEINTQRIERNPRLRVITGASVTAATKGADGWSVTVTKAPAYVNDLCTVCGDCSKVCPSKVSDPFNLGMCEVPAIRSYHQKAWPAKYVLNRDACESGCKACVDACKYNAINLDAAEEQETLDVAAVIMATGWQPYAIEKLEEFGGGSIKDVVANVNMERMVAPEGPTDGKIIKPSDGNPPKNVAFVQCAGSRDVNHLPYCSGVCCLASLKQAIYVKEQLPETEVTMYYIDRRAPGRNEDLLTRVADMDGVKLVKGKVGKIEEAGGALKLRVEDVESGKVIEADADMAVLATGMVPHLKDGNPFDLQTDDDGFGLDNMDARVLVAGVARRPEDVAASTRDATGAAAKSLIAALRRA
jgi:quinone-modifying oxidoreductase subunit QmoA